MRHGRWYPTQVLQPDGRTLIMSGLDESGQPRRGHDTPLNKDVEVFTPSSDPNGRGTISLASGPAPALKGMYPHTFVMPSGRTLVAGPYAQDSFFMTPDAERTSYAYGDVANLRAEHYWGTAVLMPGSTQVLVVGGSDRDDDAGATKATEVFDEAAPGAGWRAGAPLNTGRAHHNTVILPDRSLATFGGGYGDVGGDQWVSGPEHKTVELYDPASGRWRLGPAQAENRSYHSTAVLLPDGRVMSAGDDVAGGIDRDTAEIYEPPYLFKGPRPTIASAPASVRWGAPFGVGTPDAIASAVLVAPAAVTHANDMNQRLVPLSVTRRAGGRGVELAAPASANAAPPGYYMLFVLNGAGVPSVAKWIRLDPRAPDAATLGGNAVKAPRAAKGLRGRRYTLGTFNRSLRPWSRSGAVTLTRRARSGRYAVRLRGTARRGAAIVRRLPRLERGSYRLTVWTRGRVRVSVTPRLARRTVDARSLRRWRRSALTLRVGRTGSRYRMRIAVPRGREAVVDSVVLQRRVR